MFLLKLCFLFLTGYRRIHVFALFQNIFSSVVNNCLPSEFIIIQHSGF